MKNKILLINPRFPRKTDGINIPLGLMHIGSSLFQEGYRIKIIDTNNITSSGVIRKKIRRELNGTLCVGLSVMSNQIPHALDISRFIKDLHPLVPIIWGGVHPTLFPRQCAANEYVDFTVIGEGDLTIIDLTSTIEKGGDFSRVKGIAFPRDDEIIITPPRKEMSLGDVAPLQWDLLEDIEGIGSLGGVDPLTAAGIPLQTSRGCPHVCTFCINSVTKQNYRYRRSSLVLKDIQELIDRGVNRIFFMDEDLFANKKRFLQILEGIEISRLRFRWFANLRADYFNPSYVNPELLERMHRAGCEKVGIGAESGSPKILIKLKKRIEVDDILTAAKSLSRAGIQANFSFMIGLPGESREDMKKTLELVKTVSRIDGRFRILGPQIFRPYPGSELYNECREAGMREPQTLEKWAVSPYIQSRLKPGWDYLYPWIQGSIKDLNNIAFYTPLLSKKLQSFFLTNILLLAATKRFDAFYFRFPIEKFIHSIVKGLGILKIIKRWLS